MASKSKKRRRVFRASCILAALIIAGSSFAWFTSTDEVTNRLSAQADFGVKIVESFAPPKNMLPGQEVNKDVYATNTGSIPAFVKEEVSTVMTVTIEKNTPDLVPGKSVEIEDDERYAVEAGSFLAYKPNGSKKVLGEIVVARPGDKTETEKLTFDPKDTVIPDTTNGQYTDFVPDVEGLYVFRRVVNVAADGTETFTTDGDYNATDVTKLAKNANGDLYDPSTEAAELAAAQKAATVGYDAYYFVPGFDTSDPTKPDHTKDKYYKISNLSVVPDNTPDKADDNVKTDGILLYASAGFVEEEEKVLDPMDLKCVEYADDDAAHEAGAPSKGKYLVASYDTGDSNKETAFKVAADLYDKAIHQLEYATALQDAAVKEFETAKGTSSTSGYEKAKSDYEYAENALEKALNGDTDNSKPGLKKAKSDYEDALVAKDNAEEKNEEAKRDYENSMKKLYGKVDGSETETPTKNFTDDSLYGKFNASRTALADYDAPAYTNDLYFINELKAFVTPATNSGYVAKADYPADATAIGNITSLTELESKSYPASFYEEFQTWLAEQESSEEHEYYATKAQYLIDEKNYKDEYAKCFGTYGTNSSSNAASGTYQYNYTGANGAGTANYCTAKILSDAGDTFDSAEEAYLGAKPNNDGKTSGAIYDFNKAVKDYNTAYDTMMKALDVKNEKEEQKDDASTIYNAALTEKNRAENEYLKYVSGTGSGGILNANAFGTAGENTLDMFIKLANVVCDDGTTIATVTKNDQWQHHPHQVVNDVAEFYYTGILESGETTSKLIDSVTLSSKATTDMYKSFDFDINVAMKSVQVAYDENNDITATATPTELGAFANLKDKTDVETPVKWVDTTALSEAAWT